MTTATEKRSPGRLIPARFQERVALHLIKNDRGEPHAPLIQLWHGQSGSGKTNGGKIGGFAAILAALKARAFVFGSSRLESHDGGPKFRTRKPAWACTGCC